MSRCQLSMSFVVAIVSLTVPNVFAQTVQDRTVQSAGLVLNEALTTPLNHIPAAMLNDCHGVAIVPNVIKGGFIVGARHGKGLLFVKGSDGVWHAPVFITLTGGNIGWQIGVQASDIVLVFKTPRSIDGILSGKLTIGGDVAAAAGPVGRQTAVATDGNLTAEIYTYSRSRGLFAGVSIDGSVVSVDQLATGSYYRAPAPGQPAAIPPAALALTQSIATYAGQSIPAPQPGVVSSPAPSPEFAQRYGTNEADVLHGQLLQIAPELFDLLDAQWKTFLALPLSAGPTGEPSATGIAQAIKNYDLVASDPQFASLAARPEFKSVHSLLKHYQHVLAPAPQTLQLPPPPAGSPQ